MHLFLAGARPFDKVLESFWVHEEKMNFIDNQYQEDTFSDPENPQFSGFASIDMGQIASGTLDPVSYQRGFENTTLSSMLGQTRAPRGIGLRFTTISRTLKADRGDLDFLQQQRPLCWPTARIASTCRRRSNRLPV